MSSSGVPDNQTPNFKEIADGYKTEIRQSLETVKLLHNLEKDPEGTRLIVRYPQLLREVQDLYRRMEAYDQMDGKSRVSTALRLYYEQAGKKSDNEPGKKLQILWHQLVTSAQQGDDPPIHL